MLKNKLEVFVHIILKFVMNVIFTVCCFVDKHLAMYGV